MYRIDNPSSVVTLQAPPAPRTAGFFTDGNPAAGLEATIVDAWWMNQLQEEIISVIAAANITLNKSSHHQLLDALNTMFTGAGVVGGYLPLIGGTLYRAGGSDILTINADPGLVAGIVMQVAGQHQWSVGEGPNGFFRVYDNTSATACLTIDSISHDVNIRGNDLVLANATEFQYITRPNPTQSMELAAQGGVNMNRLLLQANYIELSGVLRSDHELHINNLIRATGLRAIGAGGLSFIDTCNFAGDISVGGTANINIANTNSIYNHGVLTVAGMIFANAGLAVQSGTFSVFNALIAGTAGGVTALGGFSVATGNAEIAAGNLNVSNGIWADGMYARGITLRDFGVTSGGNIVLQGSPQGRGNVLSMWDQPGSVAFGAWAAGGKLNFGITDFVGEPVAEYFAVVWNGAEVYGNFNVSGIAYAQQHVDVSDRRLKEQLSDYRRGLEAVRQFNPQSWQWCDRTAGEAERYYGLVADDVEVVAPEMVSESAGVKGIHLMPLICSLVNSVQELATKIETLEGRT
jgi:hypothetical protein